MPRDDPPLGANQERARLTNRRLVLGRVHVSGAAGRAEIARHTGLSLQAVSNIVGDLAAEGLIEPRGALTGRRGQPPVQYGLRAGGAFALGIELRPDAVIAALLDLSGQIRHARRLPVERTDPPWILNRAAALRDAALEEAGADPARLLGAGVVMPGPFGHTGIAGAGSDLPLWRDVDAGAAFEEALAVPVRIANDANAAAIAERVRGAARRLSDFAYLYFGAGIGLGLVAGGRLVSGARGNAGEIGHVPVIAGGRAVRLEDVVSRLAAVRHLAGAGLSAPDIEALEAHHAAGALRGWIAEAAPALAQAVGIVENLVDPQTIILGGALPAPLLSDLIEATRLPSASIAATPGRRLPRLTLGATGRLTAAIGGASLVLGSHLAPD